METCTKTWTFSGSAKDAQGNPIEGVDVLVTYSDGTQWTLATTDSSGQFVYVREYLARLFDQAVVFRKAGYQDVETEAIGNGNGGCGDQAITRDAVMAP